MSLKIICFLMSIHFFMSSCFASHSNVASYADRPLNPMFLFQQTLRYRILPIIHEPSTSDHEEISSTPHDWPSRPDGEQADRPHFLPVVEPDVDSHRLDGESAQTMILPKMRPDVYRCGKDGESADREDGLF